MILELFAGSTAYGAFKIFQVLSASHKLEKGDTLKTGEKIYLITDYSKCVDLFANETEYNPPIFLNTGNTSAVGVGIPVGGGLSSKWKSIYSVLYGGDDKSKYINYKMKLYNSENKTYYINNAEEYTTFMNNHKYIENGRFPVTMPLKVNSYELKTPLWATQQSAIISDNRSVAIREAVQHYAFRGWRTPVSIAAGSIWFATACLCVIIWDDFRGPKYQLKKYKEYIRTLKL